MAVRNLIICDIDGKEDAESHRITVDDQTVTIDLCSDCNAKLSKVTDQYFAKGQVKVKASTNGTGISDTQLVRSWLRGQGHQVPDKGRIPGNLQELYDAAHPGDQPQLVSVDSAPAPSPGPSPAPRPQPQ